MQHYITGLRSRQMVDLENKLLKKSILEHNTEVSKLKESHADEKLRLDAKVATMRHSMKAKQHGQKGSKQDDTEAKKLSASCAETGLLGLRVSPHTRDLLEKTKSSKRSLPIFRNNPRPQWSRMLFQTNHIRQCYLTKLHTKSAKVLGPLGAWKQAHAWRDTFATVKSYQENNGHHNTKQNENKLAFHWLNSQRKRLRLYRGC